MRGRDAREQEVGLDDWIVCDHHVEAGLLAADLGLVLDCSLHIMVADGEFTILSACFDVVVCWAVAGFGWVGDGLVADRAPLAAAGGCGGVDAQAQAERNADVFRVESQLG